VTPAGCTLLASPGPEVIVDVWATSLSNIYVIRNNTGVAHYNGTSWTLERPGTFSALWGADANDIYAVDTAGGYSHWTGASWTSGTVPSMSLIAAVWGTSSSDVYVSGQVGSEAYAAHWNGSAWSPAFTDDDRWGGGVSMMLDGFTRSGRTYATGFGITTNFPQPYFFANDGNGWIDLDSATAGYGKVWVAPNGTLYTASSGDSYVATFGQTRFDVEVGSEGGGKRLAVSGNEVFAGSQGVPGTYRGNGLTFVNDLDYVGMNVAVGPNGETYGIDSYASGDGSGIFRYTKGAGWQNNVAAESGHSLSIAGFGDVWFVRFNGEVVHWGGTFPLTVHSSLGAMTGVWTSGHNDTYAVGGAGVIQHWNGTSWTPQASTTNAPLAGVWGLSATDLYAYGDGVVLHSDGVTWTALPSPGAPVLDLWAGGSTDVWIITKGKGALRFNGDRWAPVDVGTNVGLVSIVGARDSVYVSDVISRVHRIVRAATW
jgi:hypothetical protein